jgi:cobalt transporter subunit CbtB
MATRTASLSRSDAGLATILFVAFLGAGLLYVAGFASASALHDAAHDTRHSVGFPCH